MTTVVRNTNFTCTFNPFQIKERVLKPVDLSGVLVKCKREDDVEEQPLHVDEGLECIKCTWCPDWKGSQETKVINQHTKTAKSHERERRRLRGEDVRQGLEKAAQGVHDIRQFFTVN